MDSYIVRIYRRNSIKSGDEVAGLVEEVGTDQRRSFQTFSGLMTTVKEVVGRSDEKTAEIYHLHTGKELARKQ